MTTRREFVAAASAGLALRPKGLPPLHWPIPPDRPHPTPSQLAWQRDELAMFLHFGVNTFTDREWGDGREDPAIFAPSALDARQWAQTARGTGFRTMILTAKHHDGFCLWPSRTTTHSVASSPFRGGNGDVVREFVDACRAEGLKPGLYLSPWDRNAPAYGSSRYNDLYCDQLTELLTNYGPIHEVWFDGANGEGPNGKRQVYDWPRTWALVRKLQPEAVMFSDAGPDVRWIGNENGSAGETNWSTVDPAVVPVPGVSGDAVMRMLQQGDPAGTVWRPGETDVSIRPGWFHHPAEDTKVKPSNRLIDLYFSSVGRNSKLLLNVPPTREGLLNREDWLTLILVRRHLDEMFAQDLIARSKPIANSLKDIKVRWKFRKRLAIAELDLGARMPLGITDLREDIANGQTVTRYTVEGSDGGAWRPLSHGTTIGYRKLDRFTPVAVRKVRVTIDDLTDKPRPVSIRLYPGTSP
jgi:alpha-L-fucosidase